MVVNISSLVDGFDTNAQGQIIFDYVIDRLSDETSITLDFKDVFSITSSFANTSVVQLLDVLGESDFRAKIKLVNANKQVAQLLRLRLTSEAKKAA